MWETLHILLVDDNPDDRLLVMRELRREFVDLRLSQVTNAQALARALSAADFDLVITDYQLRWSTGLDVLAAVRERLPEVPVIMFTGTGNEEIAVAAMKAGLDDYVLKTPAHFRRLPAAVRAVLEKRERQRAVEQAVQRREAILEAVAFAAEQFLKQTRWEESINDVLARLGQAADVSRIYIFENHVAADGTLLTSQRHEWVAPGITPQINNPELQGFPWLESGFGRWMETLAQGQVIWGHVREFPPIEQEILAAQDILSIAVVPIFVDRVWWGFIGFDECRAEREWSPAEIEALRAAANTLGAAIQRQQVEEEKAALLRFQKEMLDTAAIWIDTLDTEGNVTFWNRAAERISGYTREEVVGHSKIWEWLYPDPEYREQILASVMEITQEGKRDEGIETIIHCKNGEQRTIAWYSNNLVDEDGNIVGSIALGADITERKRAEQALQRKLEQLAALTQASQAVTASLELDQVLAKIVSLSRKVVDADYVSVALMDEAGHLRQSSEVISGVPSLQHRIREDGFTRWIARSHQAVVVDEIAEDGTVSPEPGEGAPRTANPCLVQAGIRSCVGLPLLARDRLLGVLYLHSMRPRAFQGQLDVLTTFVSQAAIAIENARLYQEARRRAEEIAALREVNLAILSTLERSQVFEIVLDQLGKVIDYDTAYIKIITPDGKDKMIAGRGPVIHDQAMWDGFDVRGNKLVREMKETGHTVVVYDARTDERYQKVGHWEAFPSWAGAPLFVKGDLVGYLAVEKTTPGFYDENAAQTLGDFARTVAVALENARLYEDVRRQAAYQEALNTIIAAATTESDLDKLLATTLDEVLTALDMPIGGIWVEGHQVIRNLPPDFGRLAAQLTRQHKLDFSQPVSISGPERGSLSEPLATLERQLFLPHGIRAILAVPILGEAGRVGGLAACSPQPHTWTQEETALVEAVGRQVGAAMERLRLIRELQEALQAREEMIQNVSHELRTPLALIRGYSELLAEGGLGAINSDQQEAVDVVLRNTEKLTFMVDRLILMQTLDRVHLRREPLPLGIWLKGVLRGWEPRLAAAGLGLKVSIPESLPSVAADPDLLAEVVDNLLDNAVKFSPDGGVIQVRSWAEEGKAIIAVSDQGVGVPPEKQKHLFERFYQVDGSATRRFGGVGIGLALCREIVEKHEGRIWVESAGEGQGATFYVELPVAS